MWVRSRLGVNGEKSWREIHGENCIELDFKKRKLQDSISESRTFPIDIDDFDYIRARVAIYCAHVSKRLVNAAKSLCSCAATDFIRKMDTRRRTAALTSKREYLTNPQ